MRTVFVFLLSVKMITYIIQDMKDFLDINQMAVEEKIPLVPKIFTLIDDKAYDCH